MTHAKAEQLAKKKGGRLATQKEIMNIPKIKKKQPMFKGKQWVAVKDSKGTKDWV